MIEHVLDLGNQLKKDLETSKDFIVDSYSDLLIVGMGGSGVAGDVLKLILNELKVTYPNRGIFMQLERRQWVPEASENLVQDLANKVSGLSSKELLDKLSLSFFSFIYISFSFPVSILNRPL